MKLMRVSAPEAVLALIQRHFAALEAEQASLLSAGGRCLTEDISSPEDIPGFKRSTVDGYAVKAEDTFGASEQMPALLECVGEVFMGREAPGMESGQCLLIHTGGMLPEEADAVVMVEDTEVTGETINIYRQVAPDSNIIGKGEDMVKGLPALKRGTFLRSPELGLLAAMGISEVSVYRKPLMGILSSGDELVPFETESLDPGQVRDCNSPALSYLGEKFGAEVINGGILPDIYSDFYEKSRSLLEKVDFLVLSGGSSVGTRDFTALTLQELGKPGLLVEGISIQPGKPTLLANCDGKPVMGLPGHPVSALNIFSLFGRAVLKVLAGNINEDIPFYIRGELTRNIPSRSGRTDYIRVRIEENSGKVFVSPVFGRSGMLRTMAEADGYIVIDSAKEGLPEKEMVSVYPLD